MAEANVAASDRKSILTRALAIGTATWSDALDELGIPSVMSGLALRSGSGRRAGFAATARAEVSELGRFAANEFGLDRLLQTAGPTQILVVDAGGAEVSAMGGIGGLSAHLRGIEAVIIDGGCRDLEDIQTAGLWVASRYVTPRTGKRRLKHGHFGAPARVGGVIVYQDDLVVADATGIVVIPQVRIMETLSIAERINSSDGRKTRAVQSGQSLAEARAADAR